MSYLLDILDEVCGWRLRERNAGDRHPFQVNDHEYDQFMRYFSPPAADEGFNASFTPSEHG